MDLARIRHVPVVNLAERSQFEADVFQFLRSGYAVGLDFKDGDLVEEFSR
ncbi:hypothetical protein Q669_19630 [Labrenzia sp. C1B10]|nr:hypothetical protein Q669_19630 [Labrenzia sp. C1B10]ERR00023.1 hypothetical protein Q675_10705 [Labrenzia sp. C1B70]